MILEDAEYAVLRAIAEASDPALVEGYDEAFDSLRRNSEIAGAASGDLTLTARGRARLTSFKVREAARER